MRTGIAEIVRIVPATRGGADNFASNAPFLNSVGEFGSLLRYVFAAESDAMFAWSRTDSIRGRPVQVFSYRVDPSHSQNRISYILGTAVTSSLVGFRGLLFIDPATARVLRITEETDPFSSGLPVRGVSLILNYRDVEVGNAVYLLPDSFNLEIRLRKRTHVRNEVTFRSYQRFGVQSRLVPERRQFTPCLNAVRGLHRCPRPDGKAVANGGLKQKEAPAGGASGDTTV